MEFSTFISKNSIPSEASKKNPVGTEQKDPEGTGQKGLEEKEKNNKAEPSQLDDQVEGVEFLFEEGEEEEAMTDDEETEPTLARELFPEAPAKVGEDAGKVEAPKEVEPRKVEEKVEEKAAEKVEQKVPKEPEEAKATGKPSENNSPKEAELTKDGKAEAEKQEVG